jgi:glycosyltransferase involved in cell wall biosynthesis
VTSARLSIAMATYNGGRFIAEQLDSFAAQTRLPDELVVTDDGSTDGTLEIVEKFAATAPFAVHVHRNPARLGYTLNFSEAVSKCSGEIIFLSDQDDRWFKTKIERSVEQIDAGAHVVVNDEILIDADGTVGGSVLSNFRSLGFPDWAFAAGCCTAMSRPFAELALPFPADLPFDNWVSTISDRLSIQTLIDEPLQYYRRHGANTTQSIFARNNPTTLDLIALHGLADPRAGWAKQIEAFESYAGRIEERRELAERLAGRDGVERALARIRDEQDHYRRRLALLERPRTRRMLPVLRAWMSGDYAYFAGWKSAAKDMIRR